jgi:hypothetical protein
MDKDEILRARVPQDLKFRFERICQAAGKTPAAQLRELVETFVANRYDDVEAPIHIDIHRPEKYEYGAWCVVIRLRDSSAMNWDGSFIPFLLPELPGRLFVMAEEQYRAVVISPHTNEPTFGGKFVNGEWRADLYTNGFPENLNPTSVENVRESLRTTIATIIEKFAPRSSQHRPP